MVAVPKQSVVAFGYQPCPPPPQTSTASPVKLSLSEGIPVPRTLLVCGITARAARQATRVLPHHGFNPWLWPLGVYFVPWMCTIPGAWSDHRKRNCSSAATGLRRPRSVYTSRLSRSKIHPSLRVHAPSLFGKIHARVSLREAAMSTTADIDGLAEKGETRVMGLGVGVFLIFFFSMVAVVVCLVGATTPRPG